VVSIKRFAFNSEKEIEIAGSMTNPQQPQFAQQ